MAHTFYVRLQLAINKQTTIPEGKPTGIFAPAFLDKYSYTVHIKPKFKGNVSLKEKKFSGKFKNLQSDEHTFITEGVALDTAQEANTNYTVIWDILFEGKKHYSTIGQLFENSKSLSDKWTKFSINFTSASSSYNIKGENVTTQVITAGVAWYLIKEEETFGALMNRAFKKPSQIDWDVMKDVNAHLDSVTSLTILKPGQIVIFSKTKGSKNIKLQKMKADAKEAQAAWVKANEDGKIDQTEMVLLDLIMKGHKVVPIASHEISGLGTAKSISLVDSGKPWIDGMIGFTAANFEQTSKSHQALANTAQNIPYTTEKGTMKRAITIAGSTQTKQYKLFNDSALARKLIHWDTGIKAGKSRDYIRHEVQARSAKLNGGISTVAQNLDDVGKYTRYLKRAGYVGIAIDAGMTTVKAHDAYTHGDTKGGNIEVGKGVGSIGGGVAGGAAVAVSAQYLLVLAVGVGTGGIGLVVIGVAAAVGGYYAGKHGESKGEDIAKYINKEIY